MGNFDFLQREWFAIHDTCVKAESYVNSDARAACFYARIALEQTVGWLYKYVSVRESRIDAELRDEDC